jgi:hypothetical protein
MNSRAKVPPLACSLSMRAAAAPQATASFGPALRLQFLSNVCNSQCLRASQVQNSFVVGMVGILTNPSQARYKDGAAVAICYRKGSKPIACLVFISLNNMQCVRACKLTSRSLLQMSWLQFAQNPANKRKAAECSSEVV